MKDSQRLGAVKEAGIVLPSACLVALLASPMRVTLTKSQLSTERGAELFKILCEITQDGILTDAEVERLKAWLDTSGAASLPSEKALTDLLGRLFANGKISRDERRELQKEIERILPPSQRAEAKQAREHLDAIDTPVNPPRPAPPRSRTHPAHHPCSPRPSTTPAAQ
jgi:hypothetical protein